MIHFVSRYGTPRLYTKLPNVIRFEAWEVMDVTISGSTNLEDLSKIIAVDPGGGPY